MSPQRWQRIGEIYHSALPLVQSERADFVTNACSGDSALREEVNSLLEADESSGDFLRTSVFEVGLKILMDSSKSFETVASSDQQGPDKLVGTTLDGRYLVESKLGQGGVGAVYLARDHKLHDKRVVVKVLLDKSLRDSLVLVKFQQEKEALARVDHPGVVGIIDTGELPDGKPYIVMQYVEGMSLRDAIKAEPEGMDLEHAAEITKQIGAALTAVHEKKIYHRDLKPENIMLQRLARGGEQVKILDFGVAKVKDSVVALSVITSGATLGTVLYMSPEQFQGLKANAASDVYSFGVIAYEMITGRRPFNPATVGHLAEMHRQGVRVKPTDLRPRLPEEAERLILKALSFDRSGRQQNAGEFGDQLACALLEEETPKQYRTTEAAIPPTQLSGDPKLPGHETAPPLVDTLVTPFASARSDNTFDQTFLPVRPESRKMRWPVVAGLLVVIAVIALGAYLLIIKRQSLFGPVVERSLVYSLTVQKMRDGKAYQEPFQSSGQEIFENGYRFRLNVSSPQSGFLYVFNEGAGEKTGMSFTIIYPTPKTNNGSAKLEANQSVQTSGNTFEGKAGTEQFWMVWSASSVNELEAARDVAFRNGGELTDAAMVRVLREFLTKHSEPKPETTKDTTRQETKVRANSDVLVKLVELEHR